MTPPRRRSARLAGAVSAKKKTAPALSSVVERAESPENTPRRRNQYVATVAAVDSPNLPPSTPSSSAIKPPSDEMHPSKFHQSTGEPSSALRLGFADIKPSGPDGNRFAGGPLATPSKLGGVPASPFTFRVARESADVGLSGDAQRMMEELREKAAEIKADMVARREAGGEGSDLQGRKIAKPKGKSGRFSAAHMAEFKKMDSIENHASAWRAEKGRFTPKSGLKRSPSKANLDVTPTSQTRSAIPRSPSKPNLAATPATPRLKSCLKRKSSAANLDEYQQSPSPKKVDPPASTTRGLHVNFAQRVTAKRLKQSIEDDASSTRPVSRDGTSIPRPKSSGGMSNLTHSSSSLARLMSPTKASLAHVASQGKATVTLVPSPTKQTPAGTPGGLTKSATTGNLLASTKQLLPRGRVISPGRLQKVKSILRGHRTPSGNTQTAIPQPMGSQTPGPPRTDKALPPVPLTTPARKWSKPLGTTPKITRFAIEHGSPSPQKAGPSKVQLVADTERSVLAKAKPGDVTYPDLSGFKPLPAPPLARDREVLQPSVPGTFTFRSDHTIKFGDSSETGFGASPGQSSVRQVRRSIKPTAAMPGSFPDSTTERSHPNKENTEPIAANLLAGTPHGMANKKRHRATWDEEETEDTDERAVKKRKNNSVAEGEALLAPRLVASTPKSAKIFGSGKAVPRTPGSASPSKKRGIMSMSRLNMLARPKNRA